MFSMLMKRLERRKVALPLNRRDLNQTLIITLLKLIYLWGSNNSTKNVIP